MAAYSRTEGSDRCFVEDCDFGAVEDPVNGKKSN